MDEDQLLEDAVWEPPPKVLSLWSGNPPHESGALGASMRADSQDRRLTRVVSQACPSGMNLA